MGQAQAVQHRDRGARTLDPKVGAHVTVVRYTDKRAAVVIHRTARQCVVQLCSQLLMNAPDSGEPDALVVTQGGFAAVVCGQQRWDIQPDPRGACERYTLRESGEWKLVGIRTAEHGGTLVAGWHPHYDFNF